MDLSDKQSKVKALKNIIPVSKYYKIFSLNSYFSLLIVGKSIKKPIGNHKTLEWTHCSKKLRAQILTGFVTWAKKDLSAMIKTTFHSNK